MKFSFLFCFFSILCINLIGQNPDNQYPALKMDLQPGIIRTFSDFQKGKIEKVSGKFILSENSEAAQYLLFGKTMKLALKDSATGNVSLVSPSIWGFCDGKNIYIKDKRQYCKLGVGKKYCYYEKHRMDVIYFVPVVSQRLFFFDMKDGVITEAIYIPKLLKKYPALYDEYAKDKNYQEVNKRDIHYLKELNKI